MFKKINSIFAMLVIVMMVLVTPACALGPMTSNEDRERNDFTFKNTGFANSNSKNIQQTTATQQVVQKKTERIVNNNSYINELQFNLATVKNDSKAVYNFTAEELNKTRVDITNITDNQKTLTALLKTKTKEKNLAKAELDSFNKKHPLKLTKNEQKSLKSLISRYESAKIKYNQISGQLKKFNTKQLSKKEKTQYTKLKTQQKFWLKVTNIRNKNLKNYRTKLYNQHYTKSELKTKNKLNNKYEELKNDTLDLPERIHVNNYNLPVLNRKIIYLKQLMAQLKNVSISSNKAEVNSRLTKVDSIVLEMNQLNLDPGKISDYADKLNNNNNTTNKTKKSINVKDISKKSAIISGSTLAGIFTLSVVLRIVYRVKAMNIMAANLGGRITRLHEINKVLGICKYSRDYIKSLDSMRVTLYCLNLVERSKTPFNSRLVFLSKIPTNEIHFKLRVAQIAQHKDKLMKDMIVFRERGEGYKSFIFKEMESEDQLISQTARNFKQMAELSQPATKESFSEANFVLDRMIKTKVLLESDKLEVFDKYLASLRSASGSAADELDAISRRVSLCNSECVADSLVTWGISDVYHAKALIKTEKSMIKGIGESISSLPKLKTFVFVLDIIDIILTIYTVASVISYAGYKFKWWKKDGFNNFVDGLVSKGFRAVNFSAF